MIFKSKWAPLFLTNIFGVLNNNLLKGLTSFISIAWVAKDNEPTVLMLATALLVIPYILFSPLAGRLAKTKLKTNILVISKKAEILIMAIAALGFVFDSLELVFVSLFLLGTQSAILSPSKYGLIRDIGGNEGISYGTGVIDMTSFSGVLIATFAAGVISDLESYRIYLICFLFICIAILGVFSSVKIKVKELPVEESHDSMNPILFIKNSFLWAKSIKGLNYVILGSAFFWMIGSMVQMKLIIYCPKELSLSNTQTSIIIAIVAIGIGLGCWAAGLISKGDINMRLIPIGSFSMSIFITIITLIPMKPVIFSVILFCFAFFGGLYKVTISSWLQRNVAGRKQGDILAYNNTMDFIFILVSAVVFGTIEKYFEPIAIFIVVAFCCWLISFITLFRIPGTYNAFKNARK